MQKDPIGLIAGDTNFYRYVQNNPLISIDPYGLYQSTSGGQVAPLFKTPDEAAKLVLRQVNEFSKENNIEVGGYIFKDPHTGMYGYSNAVIGEIDSV